MKQLAILLAGALLLGAGIAAQESAPREKVRVFTMEEPLMPPGAMMLQQMPEQIEFFSAELEAIQDAIVAKHKFRPTQHSLRIFGICAQCQSERDSGTDASAAEPRIRFASAPNTQ